jgi:hypothetical protein
VQGHEADSPAGHHVRVCGRDVPGYDVHLGLGLLDRGSRSKATHDVEVVLSPPLGVARVSLQGQPRLGPGGKLEAGGHDTHHLHGLSVHEEHGSDDPGIPSEASLPESVAEDHDVGLPAHLLLRNERPSHGREHPEGREEVGGDPEGDQLLRLFTPVQDPCLPETHERRQGPERLGPVPIVQVIQVGETVLDAGRVFRPDPDQIIGLRVREGLQNHRVEDGEHEADGAHTQTQDQHRGRGEGRTMSQPPDSLPRVSHEILQPSPAPGVPPLFLEALHSAKSDEGLPPSLPGTHPLPDVAFRFHLEMETYLFVHLSIEAHPVEKDPATSGETSQEIQRVHAPRCRPL